MKSKLQKKTNKFFKKAVPLWMMIVFLLNSSMVVGFTEYYLLKKNFNKTIVELSKKIADPDQLVQILKQKVVPQKGYTLNVTWDDIGKQLLDSGIIDKTKYEKLFVNDPLSKEYMKYFNNSSTDHMTINESNSHFMVNTLWALGLVNKSKILEEGSMKTIGDKNPMNYASTGGWDLGTKSTSELYSSASIVKLTPKQEKLVEKIADNVYRPCCNNPTSFPDCNHGMAALGYIELAVKQGVSEMQIYKDLLALNSFWFPQTYVELAAYMEKRKISWEKVDAKIALSAQYSSAQGSQKIRLSVQDIKGLQVKGGSCGT